MLSEAFMDMTDLMQSRIDNEYTVDKAKETVEKMRQLKPKNITINSLISNSARNIERLEIEAKDKKTL